MKLHRRFLILGGEYGADYEYREATLEDLKAALKEYGMVAVPVEDLDSVCESMELWGMHSDDAYQTIKAMIQAAEEKQ